MRSVLVSCLLASSLFVASTANAATYYIRSGGNDSADGRSHATAWGTLSKVKKRTFATSDVLLLHEGDTFAGSLTINWGGTSSLPAVVGAYYLKNGVAKRGYAASRPVISGGNSLPSDHYDGLVRVRANRVRVENIKVVNTRGRGIDVVDSQSSVIFGCSIDGAYNSGIMFLRSSGSRAEQNYVTHVGKGMKEGAPWGSAIEADAGSDAVFQDNIVVEVYGEGINAHNGAKRTVIEGNYIYGARAVGIYADAAPNTTIRRNIVVGTTNSAYWRSAKSVGAGIAINNEKYHYESYPALASYVQSQNVTVYGNLVAFASSGLSVWGEYYLSSFDGLLVFNNTFVDNESGVFLQSGIPKPSSRFDNNIVLSLSSGTRDVSGTDLKGMVARNNYFSKGNPGGGYANSGNRFWGLSLAKMSGWRSISSQGQVTWRDFAVKSGSSVVGAGSNEPRNMASSTDTFTLDYNAATHNEPMDIGGLRYGSN